MYKKVTKRIIDLLISIILILPLSFIILLISILIKLDSKGKVFFNQERLGQNGKVFKIIKFRTMIENAESIGSGIYTSANDPRITKVGKILRKTSLDELPQIINVLKGDMSFVGPRPPVVYHPYKYSEYTSTQSKRFKVRPGITGLAQVSGRNNLTWDERILFDVEYVRRCSLITDVVILFKTILKVFKAEDINSKRHKNK